MRRGGRLVWADALLLEDDICEALDATSGFGGARAYATAVYVGPDAAEFLEPAKRFVGQGQDIRSGATCVAGVLIARWLGADPLRLRYAFESYWIAMREIAGGLSGRLPRLWYV